MSNIQETSLVIDLKALEHNYRFIKSKLKNNTRFLAVVKSFAYGSDMAMIAKKLEELKVDYFAVAYVQEGISLRENGIKSPILVLHPQPVNFNAMIAAKLEPSIYSPRLLKLFLEKAKEKKLTNYPVHLKFNTGLNRLGFWENDIDSIQEQLKGEQALEIRSILSHLAASEDASEKEFSKRQIKSFETIYKTFIKKTGLRPFRHLLNTSGVFNYPSAQYEMIRSGIGLYGFANDAKLDAQLKPVASLKTIISQIHKIEPGESVGYNRGYISKEYRVTATLPIGHADGIGRQYGNGKAFVSIDGQKAPIIGNVCMDMLMIDVTGIPCKEGDEVTLFGKEQTAHEFAKTAGTISYEILTAISQRVKRVVLQ